MDFDEFDSDDDVVVMIMMIMMMRRRRKMSCCQQIHICLNIHISHRPYLSIMDADPVICVSQQLFGASGSVEIHSSQVA